eukprot:g6000.t1
MEITHAKGTLYPALQHSSFRVRRDSLPPAFELPPEVGRAVNEPLPGVRSAALAQDALRECERLLQKDKQEQRESKAKIAREEAFVSEELTRIVEETERKKSRETAERTKKVRDLVSLMGVDEATAEGRLEECGWNVEQAAKDFLATTTSQPCSIDAGGNIFLRNKDVNELEGTTTTTAPNGGVPVLGQSDGLWNEKQKGGAGHGGGDPVPKLDENGNRGGTLYHAGAVLRCRSAGALRSLVEGSSDGRGTHSGSVPLRPTLRAYSTPIFLHSALFPPKSSSQAARGRSRAADSNTSGGRQKDTRGHYHTQGTGRSAEEAHAPCRHRRGGYLHRYKGFEQEKVSCPPVDTFRIIGGLGEFPRRRGSTAPAGRIRKHDRNSAPLAVARVVRQPRDPAASSLGPGRGGRIDGACEFSQETPGSLAVELSYQSSTEEGRSSAHPLELFAEGSKLAPESPPIGGIAGTPVWCSKTKGRPNGAKRIKAWREGAVQPGSRQNGTRTRKDKMRGGPAAGSKTSSRADRSFGAAKASSSLHKKRPSAFLPYSLERPVSPERTRAFFYTSN